MTQKDGDGREEEFRSVRWWRSEERGPEQVKFCLKSHEPLSSTRARGTSNEVVIYDPRKDAARQTLQQLRCCRRTRNFTQSRDGRWEYGILLFFERKQFVAFPSELLFVITFLKPPREEGKNYLAEA